MNDRTEPELAAWSGKRWILTVLLIAAFQIALLAWLSEPAKTAPPLTRSELQFRLLGTSETDAASRSNIFNADPTLFALVSPRGFSQSAWLLIPRFDSPVKKQPDPPQFLSLASEELTADFAEFIQTNQLPEDLFLESGPPLDDTPHLVAPGLVSGTTVTLEGPLQSRSLLSLAGLPQRTDLLLTNTVVQVLVNAAGMTVSAALLSSCKVPEADTAALAFARTARFAPLRSSALTNHATTASLTFGNLVFQWCSFRWEPPTTVGAGF